jgi:hypothetical protein
MEDRKKWFWFFRCSGSTFKCLNRGLLLELGLMFHCNRFLSPGLS